MTWNESIELAAEAAAPVVFDLYPHRSLSGRGFLVVMALIGVLSLAIGIGFSLVGAWPVIGFMGLEVGVVLAAFILNYRAGARRESVVMGPEEVALRRDVHGRKGDNALFPTYWLQIRLLVDGPRRSRLLIGSHGRFVEIGAFLNEAEKTDLAGALRAQLALFRRRGRATPAPA
ncbi:MAG: DUF2244 domain-containing protein [Pseudomonadota bacterium]|nr:DUF2244 domain-containing protein [Pseudomonadota bacterium]